MTMTVIDVVGRYGFNKPLGFAYEVTELLMATVVFVAVPSVTLRGEHITIGLFDAMWTGRTKAARELIIALFIAVCAGFLCYRMFLLTGRFIRYGDNTNILKVSLYPVAAIGAAGIGLAALAGLALAYDAARRLLRNSP
jgi:TRAP-type C4-dicarboxylate transport system permease small subunit